MKNFVIIIQWSGMFVAYNFHRNNFICIIYIQIISLIACEISYEKLSDLNDCFSIKIKSIKYDI